MLKAGFVILTLLVAGAAPASAAEDDIANRIIDVPNVAAYQVDGQAAHEIRKDPKVQGGKALRVHVPGKLAHEWDVAVAVPITKPVKAGDALVLALWARLEAGENGGATANLPSNSIQLAKEPYTAVVSGPVTIGGDWKLQSLKGVADKDYKAGDLTVSIHLATAKQVVDLGPVFVLDMGKP